MARYLLDGRLCEGVALDPFDGEGRPQRMVYWYKSTEGLGSAEQRVTNSLAWVTLGDDGSSWTAATAPRGAHLAVEAHEHVSLGQVYTWLVHLHGVREALIAAEQGGATHGEPAAGVTDVFVTPATAPAAGDTRPLWQRLGFGTKEEWKQAGKPGL